MLNGVKASASRERRGCASPKAATYAWRPPFSKKSQSASAVSPSMVPNVLPKSLTDVTSTGSAGGGPGTEPTNAATDVLNPKIGSRGRRGRAIRKAPARRRPSARSGHPPRGSAPRTSRASPPGARCPITCGHRQRKDPAVDVCVHPVELGPPDLEHVPQRRSALAIRLEVELEVHPSRRARSRAAASEGGLAATLEGDSARPCRRYAGGRGGSRRS